MADVVVVAVRLFESPPFTTQTCAFLGIEPSASRFVAERFMQCATDDSLGGIDRQDFMIIIVNIIVISCFHRFGALADELEVV